MTINRTPRGSSVPNQARNRVGRRTLMAGAAWSVPTVAVVSAAPAYANSQPLPPVVPGIDSGTSCKLPGDSCKSVLSNATFGYYLTLCFTNTTNNTATVTIDAADVSGAATSPSLVGQTYTVGPRARVCKTFLITSSNSAQRDATINYTVVLTGGGGTYSDDFAVNLESFDPCDKCEPRSKKA